jgi:hypothetical protein
MSELKGTRTLYVRQTKVRVSGRSNNGPQLPVPSEHPSIASARLADRELYAAEARRVEVTADRLVVDLKDGRIISLPRRWFPRLVHGTTKELANYRISHGGLHWPDLDEDISVRSLLLGRRDGSSRAFLKFWLANKKKGRLVFLEDWIDEKKKKGLY